MPRPNNVNLEERSTWTLTNKTEKMLMTWERKVVRKIYGLTKENGQWRIKTNLELMTKYKSQDIVTVIKIRRLERLGHVIRINETRSVKKILEGKLEGRRGRGRPRLRWIDDVEDDLRKIGVKRWRAKALDREEWASIIRKTKGKLNGAVALEDDDDRFTLHFIKFSKNNFHSAVCRG